MEKGCRDCFSDVLKCGMHHVPCWEEYRKCVKECKKKKNSEGRPKLVYSLTTVGGGGNLSRDSH